MSRTKYKSKAPVTLYQVGASSRITPTSKHCHAEQSEVLAFKPASPTYEDVFGKTKPEQSTTGSDITVLRAYMHLCGMPQIAEGEPISVFATLFARQVLPRHKWRIFPRGLKGTGEARQAIRRWASELFPKVVAEAKAKPQPVPHAWMIPELMAHYDPQFFGLGVK